MNLGSVQWPEPVEGALAGLKFLTTGVFDTIERQDLHDIITGSGGRIYSGMSKYLDYLLVGRDAGPAKLADADEYNITKLSEEETYNFLMEKLSNAPKNENENVEEEKVKVKKASTSSASSSQKSKASKRKNEPAHASSNGRIKGEIEDTKNSAGIKADSSSTKGPVVKKEKVERTQEEEEEEAEVPEAEAEEGPLIDEDDSQATTTKPKKELVRGKPSANKKTQGKPKNSISSEENVSKTSNNKKEAGTIKIEPQDEAESESSEATEAGAKKKRPGKMQGNVNSRGKKDNGGSAGNFSPRKTRSKSGK